MSWALILLTALLLAWLRWRIKNRRLLEMAETFPGPPTLPFLGNALSFVVQPEDLAGVLQSLMVKYGSVLRFWLGPDLNIVIGEPDDLKVLLTNNKTSFKGPQYKYMTHVIGGGILSGSGPTWRKHRKLATPNYGKRAVESYNDIINQEIDFMLNRLKNSEMGVQRDIYKDVVMTTSYTVCQALMGLSREQTLELPYLQELINTSPSMYHIIFDRMTRWYLQIDPVFRLNSRYHLLQTFIKRMNTFCDTIIEHRRDVLKDLNDTQRNELMTSQQDTLKNTELSVVDRFILSQELDSTLLRQETFTIFTSSQEASAKITSSILLMMAYHPKCQEKLYEEITSVMGDEDRWISDEDMKRMPYLEMVFCEAIRLFPIGAMIQRTIKEDITTSFGALPAGCSLLVPVYHIQRDPRFWKDPDAFDPGRFSPENVKTRPANCYLPFSLGPMDCLGRYFGKKLIKMISVRVLREYKLTSSESYKDLKLSISISASPINGYNVSMTRRK